MNRRKKALGHNRGLNAMGAEVLNSTFVLLLSFCGKLNICASNPPLRQAPKRWLRNVQDYFQIVKSKFIELDKITPLTTETISAQIKTHYLLLCKEHKEVNQKIIFDALVSWLSKRTKQDNDEASEIIISYFIQNCEVF
jgi:hypothetical protein